MLDELCGMDRPVPMPFPLPEVLSVDWNIPNAILKLGAEHAFRSLEETTMLQRR